MPVSPVRRSAVLLAASAAVFAGGAVATAGPAAAACTDVEVIFARGTGEPQGPSVLQRGTVSALKGAVGGRSVQDYSVVYPAGADQNAAPGAADLVKRLTAQAAACPGTKFVLGGYSQGATVVDIAVGARTFSRGGSAIPAELAPKVAAIVTFGNPLGNNKLAAAAPAYASRIKEFCASGDPVCRNGSSFNAHLAYISNGNTAEAGRFAATQVLGSAPSPGTPAEPPATTPPTTGPAPADPGETPWWLRWLRSLWGGRG